MRYFDQLTPAERERLFFLEPEPFDRDSDPLVLATALGGTLYSPADRPRLSQDVMRLAADGVGSMVLCLEDSIADGQVPDAEDNLVRHLEVLAAAGAPLPQLFVRVRTADQIGNLVDRLGSAAHVLSGFVVPKFTEATGPPAMEAVVEASERLGQRLWVMPVLESGEIVGLETRVAALTCIRDILNKYRTHVLAVRIGGTDLSAYFGLRRSRDLSIYDVLPVATIIGDIVNVLGRADGDGFVVTGPVWEYFVSQERLLKPQLRESPFTAQHEESLRSRLIEANLDGLIREVLLDRANGLIGKTVIHPSHVAAVHALSSVAHEEYLDAQSVLSSCETGGGVRASSHRNKMNEGKPHYPWAVRVIRLARVYGVTRPEVSVIDLLAASSAR
jgi:citrate lyase beta subunit